MNAPRVLASGVLVVLLALTACSSTVAGTATWPGATLEQSLLTQADFPAGVHYDRIVEDPGVSGEGIGGPPSMLSKPQGCANALTNVIAKTVDRGLGAAAKYNVTFDGARIVMTVLSSRLDLGSLEAAAARCEHFEAYFDAHSPGIPMTTTKLAAPAEGLAYQQTMQLRGGSDSVYMSFANAGSKSVFGIAFAVPDPSVAVKATLPQTILDITDRQVRRIRS
jgi:hypothetical protein